MVIHLSAEGQLTIPPKILKALRLKTGATFEIAIDGDNVILIPIDQLKLIEELYGKFADVDLLTELEKEHRQEQA